MRIKYKKMIFFITMGIMGIGMLTISFETKSQLNSKSIAVGSNQVLSLDGGKKGNTTPTISLTSTPTPIPEDPKRLKLNDIPEIDILVQTYYAALLNTDEDAIASCITDASAINIEVISKKLEYISNFHNIVCYTKPGLTEGEYVVYVSYDMEVASIDTYAPSLDYVYLTTIDGNLYIYSGNPRDDIKALQNEYNQTQEVMDLKTSIDQALQEACSKDQELKEFNDNLKASIKKEKPTSTPKEATTDETTVTE